MKKDITCYLITLAILFCIYGCSDKIASTNNNTNNSPTVPKNPSPPDSAVNIDESADVILTWESTDPDLNDTLKFDLFAGATLPLSDIPLAANITSASYNMGILFQGATYYWKIKAKDNHGGSATGEVWNFTIISRPQ